MTDERRTAVQKAAATRRERKERENERIRQARRDAERALEVCRAVRDDPEATNAERLKAVELLERLTEM